MNERKILESLKRLAKELGVDDQSWCDCGYLVAEFEKYQEEQFISRVHGISARIRSAEDAAEFERVARKEFAR